MTNKCLPNYSNIPDTSPRTYIKPVAVIINSNGVVESNGFSTEGGAKGYVDREVSSGRATRGFVYLLEVPLP